MDQSIEDFLAYYHSVRRRTRSLAECIPEEHLEARSGEGRFSPADLIRHIAATERWMWGENVRQRPSLYPGHGLDLAQGKKGVLAYLDTMQDQTAEIIGALSPDDIATRCMTVGGIEMRVWKWLRLMIEHEIHHRGQLYELLGSLGVQTPPLYGLTEPEVRDRSQ